MCTTEFPCDRPGRLSLRREGVLSWDEHTGPNIIIWATLKRLGRDLLGKPRLQRVYRFQRFWGISQQIPTQIGPATAGTDSTPVEGCSCMGVVTSTVFSRTQSLVALSSAESETYKVVKKTSETQWFRPVLQYIGEDIANRSFNDGSAVLGIIQRQGFGNPRHLESNSRPCRD